MFPLDCPLISKADMEGQRGQEWLLTFESSVHRVHYYLVNWGKKSGGGEGWEWGGEEGGVRGWRDGLATLNNIFGDTVQDTMTPQTMTVRDSLNVAR